MFIWKAVSVPQLTAVRAQEIQRNVQSMCIRALTQLAAGDLHEARRDFERSLCFQETSDGYFNIGLISQRTGDIEYAIFALERAEELDRTNVARTHTGSDAILL